MTMPMSGKATRRAQSRVDVTADPRMKPGDCILECELGVVDASLETQLKAIEHALLGKIRES